MNGKRFAWQVMTVNSPFFFTLLILLRKFVYFEFCYPGCCKIAFYWRNAFACWDKKTRRYIDSMYMLHSFFVNPLGLLFSLWLYYSFFLCSILVLGFIFHFNCSMCLLFLVSFAGRREIQEQDNVWHHICSGLSSIDCSDCVPVSNVQPSTKNRSLCYTHWPCC